MFKSTIIFCICLSIFALVSGGVYTEKYFKDPAHPGKCVIQNKVLSPGQSIKHPIMQCAEFTCDNAQGMATIETCDPIHALASPLNLLNGYDKKNPPRCTWGDFIDTAKPYPQCCERHYSCVL